MEYKNLVEQIHGCRKKGYGKGLPNKLDDDFISLAQLYINGTNKQRQEIRDSISDDMLLLVIGFSDRMAIIAERKQDKTYLNYALVAHSIENFRYDFRENVFRLALVNHVCEKLNCNPSEIFQFIASISTTDASKRLLGFLGRPPETKSLKAMKIVEFNTEEGVDYKWG